jgi:peptide/nickel transport system substrate-binding protein
MKTRTLCTITSLLIIVAVVVTGCGATPTATPTKPPATATTAPAAPTATKAPAAAATTAPAAAPTTAPAAAPTTAADVKKGGKVTVAVWQSPATLNYNLGTQTVMDVVDSFILEGLTKVIPDGSRVPNLVTVVPSVQNGGVSADGKTVTYHLLPGLKFSDGSPLTCADVQFTQKAIMTPGIGIVSTTGYSDIDTVQCPDPTTVVITFKNFFAPYLTLFSDLEAIYPQSAGDPTDMKNWAYNRKPLGSGPFKVDEWVADDHLTLSRNPNFRIAGQPYLDQVIIRIVPSSDVAMQLVSSGEVDVMWNNTEADIPQLDKMTGVKISAPLQIGGERLFLKWPRTKIPLTRPSRT